MSFSRILSFHMVMLSRIVPENSVMFWLTVDTLAFTTSGGSSLSGTPSKSTSPPQGWYNPLMTLDTVDFPQPEGPTNATELPLFSRKLSPWTRGFSRVLYPKEISRSSTLPSSLEVFFCTAVLLNFGSAP